jgi:hypothetical protein
MASGVRCCASAHQMHCAAYFPDYRLKRAANGSKKNDIIDFGAACATSDAGSYNIIAAGYGDDIVRIFSTNGKVSCCCYCCCSCFVQIPLHFIILQACCHCCHFINTCVPRYRMPDAAELDDMIGKLQACTHGERCIAVATVPCQAPNLCALRHVVLATIPPPAASCRLLPHAP